MKRGGGLLAGLAVVLAFLGISNFPRGSEQQPATTPKSKATPAYQNAGIKPSSPCIEISERLRRFEETANTTAIDSWKLPDSCYKTNAPAAGARSLKSPAQLKFAIVTVPNPVTTHLPLLFDRIVETVQQAVQDDGYTYDGSWLPWQDVTEYALLADQQNADDMLKTQQAQPGILTFRQSLQPGSGDPYDGGLIIFLVGEQPTRGIRDE